jgi:DNA-binding NarL/FixJ family response regulator
MCTVMLVDDHAVFREGLKLVLEPYDDLTVVAEASGPPEAYAVMEESRPDVIVLDMRLADADGVTVAREMIRRDPRSRILMLTMVDEAAQAAQAFAAGALGYATKDEASAGVARAILAVAARQRYLSPALSPVDVDQEARRVSQPAADPLASLTRREREIFELTLSGATSGEIGRMLVISPRTVETHRGRILHKLHARTTLELVRMAARLGMLGPEKPHADAWKGA